MMFVLQAKGPDDPVLLWLQGGPGGSSLFGALIENGPFGIDKDLHSENTLYCSVSFLISSPDVKLVKCPSVHPSVPCDVNIF